MTVSTYKTPIMISLINTLWFNNGYTITGNWILWKYFYCKTN